MCYPAFQPKNVRLTWPSVIPTGVRPLTEKPYPAVGKRFQMAGDCVPTVSYQGRPGSPFRDVETRVSSSHDRENVGFVIHPLIRNRGGTSLFNSTIAKCSRIDSPK